MALLSFGLSLLIASPLFGVDLNFRFESGYCQKAKTPGTNPEYFGECGNLTNTRFINQTYKDINLKGGVFNSGYFYVTEISGGDLSHASFRRSILLQTQLHHLKATNLDFRGSQFKGVSFADSDLQDMLATGSRFIKTDFQNCDLRNSNLWGSELLEVNFSDADLRGANLSRTFVLFSQFKGAKFNDKTQLPFSEEIALQKGMVKVD